MATYKRPLQLAQQRDLFGQREVGITHPDVPAYVKIGDNGTIYIFSDEMLGIIIDPRSRSISFFADHVKFYTKEEDGGIKWNRLLLNSKATIYTEPAFVSQSLEDIQGLYDGFAQVFEDD